MSIRSKSSDALLLLAFLLSGTAGLGYEILWTRLLGVALGSETLAVFGVLAGFFLGLAVGAVALQRYTRRSRDPLLVFAALEGAAALFAALSPHLLYWLAGALSGFGGARGSASALLHAVAISAIALLPATICLGGTLAAMVEARRRARPSDLAGRGLGRLYGANTLGAMLGTLLAVYFVLPRFGFVHGAWILAAVGVLAATTALIWGHRLRLAGVDLTTPRELPVADAPQERATAPRWLLHTLAFGTGFVGVGFEVVGVRVLAQGLENTIFTFANILAVYLAGTAAGAWIYARLAARARARRYHPTVAGLIIALALSVVLAAIPLRFSPELLAAAAPVGTSYGRQLIGELLVALAVFGVPTLLMGALFSHLVGALSDRATGYAYGLNTLGATLAPFVFGLLAVPKLGYTGAYYVVAYCYLALFCLHTVITRAPRILLPLAILLVVGLDFAAPTSLSLITPPPGWRLVQRDEGLFGAVLVVERRTPAGLERRLQLGRHLEVKGRKERHGERRMGHIPMLLAPRYERVLFLGVGTGSTLAAVRAYRTRHVDAVELVPEILRALPYFAAQNASIQRATGISFHAGDARRFVIDNREPWDTIVADLFHPARDGAASLYSLEHFRALRSKLRPDGIFVQWLPLYQFSPDDLKLVVRTFLAAFDDVHSFLGSYDAGHPILALVGHQRKPGGGGLKVDVARLRDLLERSGRQRYVSSVRDLLGSYMLDRSALARFAGPGPLNSDLDPLLTFSAPRSAYDKRDELAWASLAALLPLRVPCPAELLSGPSDERQAVLDHTRQWFTAVGAFLEADVARVRWGLEDFPPGAIERLLAAHRDEPKLAPARDLLLEVARRHRSRASEIYRRMLRHDPGDLRLHAIYLGHLRASGQTERAREAEQTLQAALRALRQRRGLSTPVSQPATAPASSPTTAPRQPTTTP